jgi:hypothetical protein
MWGRRARAWAKRWTGERTPVSFGGLASARKGPKDARAKRATQQGQVLRMLGEHGGRATRLAGGGARERKGNCSCSPSAIAKPRVLLSLSIVLV